MTSSVSETVCLKQRLSDIKKKAIRFFKKIQRESQLKLIDPVFVADDLTNDLQKAELTKSADFK